MTDSRVVNGARLPEEAVAFEYVPVMDPWTQGGGASIDYVLKPGVMRTKGDDGGCFAAALIAVRRWSGVIEHPEASSAWRAFGLCAPPHAGGWVNADFEGGWTCCVEQGHYGHRARKATWLYAAGVELPALKWGPSMGTARMDDGFHSAAERRRAVRTGICQRLSHRERSATPLPFRDLLLSIARTAKRREAV